MPLARFAALVDGEAPPLGRCCGLIAEHLGVVDGEARSEQGLDLLAASVQARTQGPTTLADVAAHLFGELRFTGDRARYYDRRNSLLPEVLRRRRGIPITLSVVTIEVAARVGVEACGVAMPGHFLVGEGRAPRRWLDPFDEGAWLDLAGAQQAFARVHGPAPFERSYLEPASPRAVVGRVLANLLALLSAEGDAASVLRAAELRDTIPGIGSAPGARVELAEALVAVGRIVDAISVLEQVQLAVDPRRRAGVQARVDVLRSRLS